MTSYVYVRSESLKAQQKELIGALEWSLTELRAAFELVEWSQEKFRNSAFIKLNVAEQVLNKSKL